MIEALLVGMGFGFSGGIAPGPLHTLIMTTSLQRGFVAGTRIAVAPLITDAPIITATVLLVGSMPDSVVRSLGLAGGLFLLYLGVQTIREAANSSLDPDAGNPLQDYRRGVIANLLNPHPWLFWISVGAPTLVGYWRGSATAAVVFLVGFYLLLVGSKVVFAYVIARGGTLLSDRPYRWLIVVGGSLLVGLGFYILWRYSFDV